MARKRATSIEFKGPWFEKDPRLTWLANVHRMLQALASEGQRDVQSQLPQVTGDSRRGVRGRVVALSGNAWRYTMVVSETHVEPWPGGGPKRYRGGKLEASRHAFRTTKNRIGRSRAANLEELLKGLT